MTQRDLLIAGGLVAVTLILVVVAFLPGKKKDAPPSTDASLSAPSTAFDTPAGATDPWGAPATTAPSTPGLGSDPFGAAAASPAAPVNDPFAGGGSVPPAPAPVPQPGVVPAPGADPFANDPFAAIPSVPAAPGSGPTPVPIAADPLATGPATAAATPVATGSGPGTHTVAKGETLGDISAVHYGSAKHWKQIEAANPGINPNNLKVGTELTIPALDGAAGTTGGGPGDGTPSRYVVKKGDTYYVIARRELGSASRWRELEKLNNIPAEELRPGMKLRLPKDRDHSGHGKAVSENGQTVHTVAKGELLGEISRKYYGTTQRWKEIAAANPGVAPEKLKPGQELVIPGASVDGAGDVDDGRYTVKKGDTLGTIAQRELGTSKDWKKIAAANPGVDPTNLRVGQKLKIPGGAKRAPATVESAAPAGGSSLPEGPGAPEAPVQPGAPAPAPAAPKVDYDNDLFAPLPEVPPAPGGAPRPAFAPAGGGLGSPAFP